MSCERGSLRVSSRTAAVGVDWYVDIDSSSTTDLYHVVDLNGSERVVLPDRAVHGVTFPEVAVVVIVATVSVDPESVRIGLHLFSVVLEGNVAGHVVPATLGDIERFLALFKPHSSRHKGRGAITVPLGHVELSIILPLKLLSLYMSCRQCLHSEQEGSTL